MKVINEDIENLERFVGNKKVDIHAELPLIMADAYSASKKAQEEIDKEMEEHNKETEVKLNKVLGAEKQPVPDVPEEPKVTLEEALFEDYESSLDEPIKLQNERIKNAKIYIERALSIINTYISRIDESLNESKVEDPFYVMLKIASDRFDVLLDNMQKLENLFNYVEEQEFLTLKDANQILHQIRGRYLSDDEDDEEEFSESLKEDTERDAYYDALDIPKGPERKKVAAERRQEFLKKFNLEDRAQEWKDAKGKDDPEEEEDIFTKINDELFPYDMEEVKLFTKFPGVSASKRYHSGEVTTDYDGNVIVHADAEDKFDFAKQVADAYGVEYEEPRNVRGEFIMRILTSKLED